MIESLLSSSNGHPVLLDLKHCDYESRQRIFKDFTIMENGDTLPPICSHCAVNGLSEVYYSPFNDNYALIDASFTTTFNPFPLNIYDEEISRFADHNGIIGLPLEQRVLGGYIGARRRTKGNYSTTELDSLRKFFLAPAFNNGSTKFNREDHTRNRLSLMYLRDSSLFSAAKASIMQQTSVDDESALRLLFDEYWSALPFMENLFHIIDELIYNSKYQQTEGAVDPDIRPWEHVCIGSDLDGFMDPIDICPTASHYPEFKHKLKYLIPIFLQERCSRKPVPRRTELAFSSYFGEGVSLDQCLDQLFYDSLRDFTAKYFNYPEP